MWHFMQETDTRRLRPALWLGAVGLAALVAFVTGCSNARTGGTGSGSGLHGLIKVDGSSTVYPITEAVAEEFRALHPEVFVTVGISGTGGGFKKFGGGETDISDASRPIKTSEAELCQKSGIEYIELPVAFDALAVVVNPRNDWCDSMTVAELKKLWEPAAQGKVMRWSQIRPGWPNEPIRLFGPGVDSGTFDYFTEAIVGEAQSSRGDFTASEDDNVLVQGVATDQYALGFFGVSYYAENTGRLKAIGIDDEDASNGAGPQMPTMENVLAGTYQPLARPIFIYVRVDAAERPEVAEFIRFYLENGAELSREVGYIPLPDAVYQMALDRFEQRVPGSMFAGGPQVGVRLEDLMQTTQARP